jgi:hypothetical protein
MYYAICTLFHRFVWSYKSVGSNESIQLSLGFYIDSILNTSTYSLSYGEVYPGTKKGGYFTAIKISGLRSCFMFGFISIPVCVFFCPTCMTLLCHWLWSSVSFVYLFSLIIWSIWRAVLPWRRSSDFRLKFLLLLHYCLQYQTSNIYSLSSTTSYVTRFNTIETIFSEWSPLELWIFLKKCKFFSLNSLVCKGSSSNFNKHIICNKIFNSSTNFS